MKGCERIAFRIALANFQWNQTFHTVFSNILFAVFDQLASILVLGQAADSSVRLSGTALPTAMDPEHSECCSRTNSPLEQQQGSTRRQEGRLYAKHPTILQQGSRKVSVAAIVRALISIVLFAAQL